MSAVALETELMQLYCLKDESFLKYFKHKSFKKYTYHKNIDRY